jgi:hypothetical protein
MNKWNFETCAAQVKSYVGRNGIHVKGASAEFTDNILHHLKGRFAHMRVQDAENDAPKFLVDVHMQKVEGNEYIQIDYTPPGQRPVTIITV